MIMPQRAASLYENPEGLAHDSEANDLRRTAIVGHRLANGYMTVHAPGEPCALCADQSLAAALAPRGHG
jgi:hypothetical protein